MISTALRKLTWRARFLARQAPPPINRMYGANPFPLRQRLQVIDPRHKMPSSEELVQSCRRQDRAGEPYYAIGGFRIYYRTKMAHSNESEWLPFVELVLRESFLDADHYGSHGCGRTASLSPGDVALDLGGNLGTCALIFGRDVGPEGHVYVFEPITHDVIARNLAANRVRNVTLVPEGVSDRSGEALMQVGDLLVDSSIARAPSGNVQQVTVPLTSIDEFARKQDLRRLNFIKMDIEGAEELALRGATETVERFRPRWSVASYHTDHQGEKQHPKLVRLFHDLGYQVDEIIRDGRGVRIFAYSLWTSFCNVLAVGL